MGCKAALNLRWFRVRIPSRPRLSLSSIPQWTDQTPFHIIKEVGKMEIGISRMALGAGKREQPSEGRMKFF
jgi:hypothetical protein